MGEAVGIAATLAFTQKAVVGIRALSWTWSSGLHLGYFDSLAGLRTESQTRWARGDDRKKLPQNQNPEFFVTAGSEWWSFPSIIPLELIRGWISFLSCVTYCIIVSVTGFE
ncbi:hypothetical protein ACFL27_20205 [candidate division CSSED10-310 bacterium]|uniref:Uncharacterized protein n=1 Tax=candidate division CSSED10-310 bacterium TaxID=2855610 RepID=A0ABV6Z2F8_UNCC1